MPSAQTNRLHQLIDFLFLIEKYKTIERTLVTSKLNRHESDAEHSWHLAMFAWLLTPELSQHLDQLKLLKMLLMHDLVEIYAGDVHTFDSQGRVGKAEREQAAARQLFGQLPNDLTQEFHELFDEFEAQTTVEAQVAQAFDKLQPILQNVATDGRAWQKDKLTYERVDDHKRPYMLIDPTITAIYERLMARARNEGMFNEAYL